MTNTIESYQTEAHLISMAQKLTVKAAESNNIQNLSFTILNDTFHLIPYDRAILWHLVKNAPPKLIGISGQETYATSKELVNVLSELASSVPDPERLRILSAGDFEKSSQLYSSYQQSTHSTILWVPIWNGGTSQVVLWLEKFGTLDAPSQFDPKAIQVLRDYLVFGYNAAWNAIAPNRLKNGFRGRLSKKNIISAATLSLLLTLIIRIPQTIVAPCLVIPINPYTIAAPIDGVIAKIHIKSGDKIEKGDLLYAYDEQETKHDLEASQKRIELTQSELMHALSKGFKEDKSLDDMALAQFKLNKEANDLNYAKYRMSHLLGKAPVSGFAILDNPDAWRGRPVKVGEKIMLLANPEKTKVKIWIPEKDNTPLDSSQVIKVFLKPFPEKTFEAKLTYISREMVISDMRIPSFIAEGEWESSEPEIKPGLSGHAILKGQKISIFYYLFQKQLDAVRRFFSL